MDARRVPDARRDPADRPARVGATPASPGCGLPRHRRGWRGRPRIQVTADRRFGRRRRLPYVRGVPRARATQASPLRRPDANRNSMDWIITSTDGRLASREELGVKAAALREAAKAGLPVPAWFVVSPRAFRA